MKARAERLQEIARSKHGGNRFFKKSEVEESQRKTQGERRGSYEIEVLVLSLFVCLFVPFL